MKGQLVFVLLAHLLLLSSVYGLDVYVDGVYWNSLRATGLRLKDDNIHITGRLIRGIPYSGCKPFENKDVIEQLVAQNITVLVMTSTHSEGVRSCGEDVRLKHVRDTGAVAMVYASKEYAAGYGINAYAMNAEKKVQDVDIIGLDMEESSELDDLAKDDNKVITVVINGEDSNLWYENRKAFTAVTVLLEVANFAILGMILLRLSQFVRKYGAQPSIPQICLVLEGIGSIMRILYFVDPSFCRGVWPFPFAAFLNFTHICWSLAAALLLTFYWEEVMRAAHIQAFPKLAKMKIPAIVSILILFSLSIICAVIRMSYLNTPAAAVNTVIQLLYTAPVAGFFCYGGIRILRTLYESKSITKKSENLKKVTVMLVGIAGSFGVIVLFLILFVTVPYNMSWFMTNRFIVWTSQTVEALCLVLSFQNPFSNSTSNSGQSSGSNKPTSGTKGTLTSSMDVELAYTSQSTFDVGASKQSDQ